MNKKLSLVIFLLSVVLVLTPYVGIASAGKGQEKMFFQINVTTINEPISDRIIRCAPSWEAIPLTGGDAKVVFVEIEYVASALSVTVGEELIMPTDVELTNGVVDVTVYWNVPVPYSKVLDKDEFTLDFTELFGTSAKIEIIRIGKSNQATGEFFGTFVGHGIDYLKGVKVSGIQTEYTDGLMSQTFQLTGTIMGWPVLL